ncbi:MAG: hypothetical protein IIB30_09030 [Chloroflexi bacterium]|nr:hypothetical protein [Chloroflexota bacterium]
MDPAFEIKMVRDNLSFAVSLSRSSSKGLITSSHLLSEDDSVNATPATIRSIGGELVASPTPRPTRQDLVRRMTNQVRASFVFSVIQTQHTLEQVYKNSPLEEADPDLRAARCTMYLLNASLRRGMLNPVWICPPEYRRKFQARPISFDLDTTELDGKPVVWEQFGGLDKYLALLDYCAAWVQPWSSTPAGEAHAGASGATPAAYPVLAPTTTFAEAPDPVAGFVRNKCFLGPEAQCAANALFKAYKDWCWETGRQAMAQRSFGMGLTKMGFQRRRRGQGYHWWQGIRLADSV